MWIFLLSSVVCFNGVALWTGRRLTFTETYVTVLFGLFMSAVVDAYASFEFKLWGFFDKEHAEFSGLWIVLGIYPAAASLIANWYPYFSKWTYKVMYLLGWAVFSTLYESLTLRFGIMWHDHGWNLLWSFILYPFIYYMLILHLRVYRVINKKLSSRS